MLDTHKSGPDLESAPTFASQWGGVSECFEDRGRVPVPLGPTFPSSPQLRRSSAEIREASCPAMPTAERHRTAARTRQNPSCRTPRLASPTRLGIRRAPVRVRIKRRIRESRLRRARIRSCSLRASRLRASPSRQVRNPARMLRRASSGKARHRQIEARPRRSAPGCTLPMKRARNSLKTRSTCTSDRQKRWAYHGSYSAAMLSPGRSGIGS